MLENIFFFLLIVGFFLCYRDDEVISEEDIFGEEREMCEEEQEGKCKMLEIKSK